MDDAQAVPLLLFRSCRSISFPPCSLSLTNETAICLRVHSSIILLLLLIALQIPFVVTAETQIPATRSCRAAAAVVAAPQTTAVAAVATVHHHDAIADGDGVVGSGGGGANGKQATAVDNTSGSPTVLYSNAARITAQFGDLVDAADPLAGAFGR